MRSDRQKSTGCGNHRECVVYDPDNDASTCGGNVIRENGVKWAEARTNRSATMIGCFRKAPDAAEVTVKTGEDRRLSPLSSLL
jgi:hypothetical protein